MESKKNNNQGLIVKSFLLMAVILAFIGGFVISADLKKYIDKATEKEKTEESSELFTAALKGNKTFGFDERYVESNKDYDYNIDFGTYAGSTNLYFTINYGKTRKNLKITRYNYDNENVQEYTLDFIDSVVDVFLGQFDDDPAFNTIFFLLENGDVCYSFVEDMVGEKIYGTYSTLENIRDAVKFYKGNSCNDETGLCTSTTFVQLKNGKIYNLSEYVIK